MLLVSLLGSSAACHPAEFPTAFISQCRITQVVAAVLQTVLGVILGGGAGSRLYPLTKKRAKPAVPLGANYRLIDIPVSNCINSNVNKIYCLTQFNSASLNRHLSQAYVSAPAPRSATHRVPRQEGRLCAAALHIFYRSVRSTCSTGLPAWPLRLAWTLRIGPRLQHCMLPGHCWEALHRPGK